MKSRVLASLLTVPLAVAACSSPGTDTSSTSTTALVLASASEESSLHPLMGYAEDGASKVFDGLITHDAALDLQPALGASLPEPDADGLTWTVELRDDVTFHDGSTFDAQDVVATYEALLDPASASPLTTSFAMLESVEALDDHTVRFTLGYPYAPFPHKLSLGILPSEALEAERGTPVSESALGSEPIGTGPYRLTEWRRGQHLVLEAFEDYWAGAPQVERITVVTAEDDNARAQRLQAGEVDGAVLPTTLAATFEGRDGLEVVHHASADYRTIVLPSGNPVTADVAVRTALNLAVDRQAMIGSLLAGQGEPAYSPVPGVLDEYTAPDAVFAHDVDEANRVLDDAGWALGPDGVRARDGQRLEFTLMYAAGDTVRRDLAVAFAEDAAAVGADISLDGLGWDAIEPRMGRDAVVFAGGNPFDPDLAMYQLMHSSFGGDGFNNPGSYANPAVDAALDRARTTLDPAARAEAYQEAQRAFVTDPGFVFLAFLDHSYVLRQGWTGYEPIVEPHVHGVTWGPWWNVQEWEPAT